MSTRTFTLAALLGGWMLITGCGRPAAVEPKLSPALEAAALERGRGIAGQAFALLSTNLAQALAAGGVTNALPYCSEKAYPLVAAVAASNHITLRRITHKPRNATNEANAAELDLLRGFHLALGRGERPGPLVVASGPDAVTFYSPIVITNPLCLQCHGIPGQDLTPAAAALLQKLYPQDQATGFKLGDLRGAWRIDLPLASLSTNALPRAN